MRYGLVPGATVRHPGEPEWSQVQSVIANRVTVNFENAGKTTINSDVIALVLVDRADRRDEG